MKRSLAVACFADKDLALERVYRLGSSSVRKRYQSTQTWGDYTCFQCWGTPGYHLAVHRHLAVGSLHHCWARGSLGWCQACLHCHHSLRNVQFAVWECRLTWEA